MSIKKIFALIAALAMTVSVGSFSSPATAGTIDEPVSFDAVASATFDGAQGITQLTSASKGDGTQVSVAYSFDPDTVSYSVVALTTGPDNALVTTPVSKGEFFGTQRAGLSIIYSPTIKKFVAAWSNFAVHYEEGNVVSQVLSSVSANGTTWSTPKAILASRTDSTDDDTNVSFGGFYGVQLFDNNGKIGAVVIAKPDTKITTLRALQFATSADGAKWTKGAQINVEKTSPLSSLKPKLLVSNAGVSVLWNSHNSATDQWSLFSATSATKTATFGKPVALLSKLDGQIVFSAATNAKGEALLAYVTTADGEPNFYAKVLRRSAAGAWTTQAKAVRVDITDADVLNTAVAINSKGEGLLTVMADDGSSYLNVYMQTFTAGFKAKDDQTQVASSIASGGYVFKVFYSDAGQVNLFYDRLTETPLDISEEYSYATTLIWSQGNLTDGLGDAVALNDETTVVNGANIDVSPTNDFNLSYLAYNDTNTVVGSFFMQQSWAPVWGETMPSVTSAASVSSKGGKITLTVPTDVKAAPAATTSFAWYVCTKKVAADQTALPKTCTLNKKATKAVYVASATEKGKFILATVTATNVLGSISWISASTNALK